MTARRVGRPVVGRKPSLRVERAMHRDGYRFIAGMDEVGRGALAGPVSVGVVIVDDTVKSAPTGLRDSKLVPARRRQELVAPVRRWAVGHGVGHADACEIDEVGIMAALRLAGRRALRAAGLRPDVVVLDGNHDWLSDPGRDGLLAFTADEGRDDVGPGDIDDGAHLWRDLPVRTIIKADMTCSSVAAASILAKVERDAMMVELAPRHPDYGWALNKGYAAPEHREALRRLGACEWHRRSWNLFAAPDAASPPVDGGGAVGRCDTGAPQGGVEPGAPDEWAMMCVQAETKVGGR